MIETAYRIARRPIGNPNITLLKLIKFGMSYSIVGPISVGLLWVLTEKAEINYLISAILAGCFSLLARFILSAIFAFKEDKAR